MDLAKVHLSGAPTCSVLGGPILPQFGNIGQTGGYLGKAHDPFISKGDPTRLLTLKDGVPALRMQKRQGLLDQLRATQRTLDKHEKTAGFSLVQGHARNLLNSQRFISAFNLDDEPRETQQRYGDSFLGRNMLTARRLVEAGVPLIQVSDIPEKGEQHWDLHYANIFDRLKGQLLPNLDQSLSALLLDLEYRGLLEETLVVVGGEFGRTPWIDHLSSPPQGGRQHWPYCYSMLLAGGGVRRGEVFGRSDETAAYPVSHRVGPWDLAATIFHLAGIDPQTRLQDRQGRMRPITRGEVIDGIL